MHKNVPELDDPPQVGNQRLKARVRLPGLAERFAHDGQLALDGGAKQDIGLVLVERPAAQELRQNLAGLPRIEQEL